MIYFLLGLNIGLAIANLFILLSVKGTLGKEVFIQNKIKKAIKGKQMAESISLDDELKDVSI
jgi:uncharacterized membrane protein YGL010W